MQQHRVLLWDCEKKCIERHFFLEKSIYCLHGVRLLLSVAVRVIFGTCSRWHITQDICLLCSGERYISNRDENYTGIVIDTKAIVFQ